MGLAEIWGTWEELLLGGAVLRHGTADWDAVAAELRSRTAFPHLFTPQVCEAKYDDLQDHYSGCDALFEELRKQRVAELKRELEKSEDSIGSLQSKLESLTSDKDDDVNNVDYDTSRTQSMSVGNGVDAVDYFCKGSSRESAGSFTQNVGGECTPECEIPTSACVRDDDLKMPLSRDFRKDNTCNLYPRFLYGTLKKKRGPRKRKACHIVKETSVGDSDTISCATKIDREESSFSCKQDIIPCQEKFQRDTPQDEPVVDLARILNSILQHKDISIFQSRLETQKRGKYKKIIRRHVDLQSIGSAIRNGSLTCAKELFRDLLLLCNNALVLYGKNTSEHKSASNLREIVTEHLRQTFHTPTRVSEDDGNAPPLQPAKAEKLQSARTRNTTIVRKERTGVGSPGRRRGVGRPPKGNQKGIGRHQLGNSQRKGGKKARR
ncbi:hypothetical protein HPP92_013622 [Vanilla planifolia]|uniref:Bromo domain-containing protein n=1 Tax=Vanilla planifolia TaxID=51239 RepID=A0A835QVX4_VANPL|nr:hypothetical protein HPP92_013622 [Vanilla planifolia]